MTSIILLIVYLLGVIATIMLLYNNVNKGESITVFDVTVCIVFSVFFSWVAFILCCIFFCGDKVIFTKK